MIKKTFWSLLIVAAVAAMPLAAFASAPQSSSQFALAWTGTPDPYDCNIYGDCYWTIDVCIGGTTYTVGFYEDPSGWTDKELEENALGWSDHTVLTVGACVVQSGMHLIFNGLWAYDNTDPQYAGEVCYIISTEGRPGVERGVATCEAGNHWPDGKDRPGWFSTSHLLAHGAVYDNGTAWGYWEGDMVAGSLRLPLRQMDGYWSYLFKEYCHYASAIGDAKGWCQ